MRLLELRLLNFRQHADTHVRFPTGLMGIIGPNGAGKSTLLEAIAWAIYGSEAARGTNETIRHARAAPRARVEVELRFGLAGHEYRVVRTLSSAEVHVDGEGAPAATTLGGVTEFLQARLGMVRREFFNTYFTGQKELQFLSAMGPTERGRFLSTVLGYDRLRGAQELARQRRNALRSRVEGLRATLAEPETVREARVAAEAELAAARAAADVATGALASAQKALAGMAPRWQEARRGRERHRELSIGVEAAEREEEAAQREVDRAAEELARISAAQAEQGVLRAELAGLPELVRQCDRLDALARTHERRRALAEQVREIGLELDRSVERLARLERAPELGRRYAEELDAARAEQAEAEAELETRKTAWLRDRQDAETKLQTYRDRAAELQEEVRRIRAAGPEGRCPTCQRPLGGDFERLLASMEEQWAEVTQDGRWWRSRYDQLAEKPEEVVALEERVAELDRQAEEKSRKLTRCEAAVVELEALRREREAREARREELRAEMEELPAGYDAAEHQAVALEEVTRRWAEWEAERRGATRRVSAAADRAAAGRAERAALEFGEEAYEELRSAAEAAELEARRAELAATEARGRLRGAETAAASAARAEAELEERLREIEGEVRELRHHNELDSAFTRLRGELNARVRPELGEIASALLAQLTDGRYTALEIDEAYEVVVLDEGEEKAVISGGEEDVANLVLRLSLSQMIAERAGYPLSLLVLDEVFGSLDVARRENVVRLLRRLEDRFEQVILITHLEEIRGALDHVLRVDFDERTGASVAAWEAGKAVGVDS
jgi:exonuclease SbcC